MTTAQFVLSSSLPGYSPSSLAKQNDVLPSLVYASLWWKVARIQPITFGHLFVEGLLSNKVASCLNMFYMINMWWLLTWIICVKLDHGSKDHPDLKKKNKGVWNHLLKFLMVGFDITWWQWLLYYMSIPYQVTKVDSHDFKPPEVDVSPSFTVSKSKNNPCRLDYCMHQTVRLWGMWSMTPRSFKLSWHQILSDKAVVRPSIAPPAPQWKSGVQVWDPKQKLIHSI